MVYLPPLNTARVEVPKCMYGNNFSLCPTVVGVCLKFSGQIEKLGLVVQLVRIPACHAGGREFESRPDRTNSHKSGNLFLSRKK